MVTSTYDWKILEWDEKPKQKKYIYILLAKLLIQEL